MKFLYARPILFILVGLCFVDIFGAIPFGITDTADTSPDSIGIDEWIISGVMLILAAMMIVSGLTKSIKLLDWASLVGACIWTGTAIWNAYDYLSGNSGLDLATASALSFLALGLGIIHFGIQRVAVIPGELHSQLSENPEFEGQK